MILTERVLKIDGYRLDIRCLVHQRLRKLEILFDEAILVAQIIFRCTEHIELNRQCTDCIKFV